MALPPPLSPDELASALASRHTGWTVSYAGKLHRTLVFPNFAAAFDFMSEVAKHAEKVNHHPEWSNVYNRVEIDLITHDSGGITTCDIELATVIDAVATRAV